MAESNRMGDFAMGYSDEERRALKLQTTFESMEELTQDPWAAALLTVYELARDDLTSLQEVVAKAIREGLFGHGVDEKASLLNLSTDLLDGLEALGFPQ